MYEYLIKAIIRDIKFNLQNADNGDVERSAFTAGAVTAYTDVLRNIGHEVTHGDWADNGCTRIGYLEIDGKVIVKNSKIDYEAVSKELQQG